MFIEIKNKTYNFDLIECYYFNANRLILIPTDQLADDVTMYTIKFESVPKAAEAMVRLNNLLDVEKLR